MKNAIVAQSGGPTAAINASLAGVIKTAFAQDQIDKVYGSLYGIEGILKNQILDLTAQNFSQEEIETLMS